MRRGLPKPNLLSALPGDPHARVREHDGGNPGRGARWLRRPTLTDVPAAKITPDVIDTYAEAVAEGCPAYGAAKAAGITYQTVQNWRRRGLEDRERGLETPYVAFVEAEDATLGARA